MKKFGELIKNLRKYKQLTKKALAKAANVSDVYIGHIESGKTFPEYDKVYQIAKALDADADVLWKAVCDDRKARSCQTAGIKPPATPKKISASAIELSLLTTIQRLNANQQLALMALIKTILK